MFNNITLSLLSATEAAARAAYKCAGLGISKLADQAAVDAMRATLNKIDFNGTITIGEGERDKAPMLYSGEKIGTQKGEAFDIAVDPLEGTDICASFEEGALSVLAATRAGAILCAPDVYMQKIAVAGKIPLDLLSIEFDIAINLQRLAEFKKCKISDLKVAVLRRERHMQLIQNIRKAGAKVKLINDCDITAVLVLLLFPEELDMYIGVGGAPEGVISAAAIRSLGGFFQGKLIFTNDQEKKRAVETNVADTEKIYNQFELIKAESIFIATGVTKSRILEGINENPNDYTCSSLIITKDQYTFISRCHIKNSY